MKETIVYLKGDMPYSTYSDNLSRKIIKDFQISDFYVSFKTSDQIIFIPRENIKWIEQAKWLI